MLREGVIGAYPDPYELKILLSEQMDVQLGAIAQKDVYNATVFSLIQDFEAKGGMIKEFIRVVVKDKPQSPYLKRIKNEFASILNEDSRSEPVGQENQNRGNPIAHQNECFLIKFKTFLAKLLEIISHIWSFIYNIWSLLKNKIKTLVLFLVSLIIVMLVITLLFQQYIIYHPYLNPVNLPTLLHDEDQDRFSWGDKILIDDNSPLFNVGKNQDERKLQCLKNFKKKADGVKAFETAMKKHEEGDLEEAAKNFKSAEFFLFSYTEENCSLDSEAKIYLYNCQTIIKYLEKKDIPLFKIAVVVPLSRDSKRGVFESREILEGIFLSQKAQSDKENEDNAPKFLVGIADDGSTPEKERAIAKKIAQHLVHKKNRILGVVGHFSSNSTESAASIYKAHKMSAISPTSTAKRRDNKDLLSFLKPNSLKLNDYIFRTSINDALQPRKITSYILNWNNNNPTNHIGQVIIIYQDSIVYSRYYKKEFERAFIKDIGGSIINQNDNFCNLLGKPRDTPYHTSENACIDYIKKYLMKNKRDNNLALMITTSTEIADRIGFIIDQLEDYKDRIHIFGSDSLYQEEIANRGGVVVAVTLANEDMEKKEYGQINWRTGTSYDAIQTLIQGLTKVYQEKKLQEFKQCFTNSTANKCNHGFERIIRSHLHTFLLNMRQLSDSNLELHGIVKNIEFDDNNDRMSDNKDDLLYGGDIGVLVCSGSKTNGKKVFIKLSSDKQYCRNK
jgi:ABC-type branched-subunit amino acid transport system substrate-binding protein